MMYNIKISSIGAQRWCLGSFFFLWWVMESQRESLTKRCLQEPPYWGKIFSLVAKVIKHMSAIFMKQILWFGFGFGTVGCYKNFYNLDKVCYLKNRSNKIRSNEIRIKRELPVVHRSILSSIQSKFVIFWINWRNFRSVPYIVKAGRQ